MQVLRGSHELGRIDHVLTGEQAGADMERVAEIQKRLELSTWTWSRAIRCFSIATFCTALTKTAPIIPAGP